MPDLGILKSRSLADASVNFLGKEFGLPVIPANMKSVVDERVCERLSQGGYFYIMHRFGVDLIEFCRQAQDWKTVSISVGVKEEDAHDIIMLSRCGLRVDYVTIDIAHGHSTAMKKMIKLVKQRLPNAFVIAGNVASEKSVLDLIEWGADSIKVGIGQGSPCSTKDKTGFTAPMFTCVQNCANAASSRVPIIADGGIKCNGDIAKAIVAGADLIMAGSLFSACLDSSSENVEIEGRVYKKYFGSASEINKGHNNHVEGFERNIESNGMSFFEKMKEIKQDLQSSISYGGGKRLFDLKKSKYILV
jgi:GMP reductase